MVTTRLFHTTDQAAAILAGGFRDGHGSYGLAHLTMTGVFLSRRPADVSDGAVGDQVLEVVFPDGTDLSAWAIAEQGHPVWEWCVPAAVVNADARVRLLSEHDVDEARWGGDRGEG